MRQKMQDFISNPAFYLLLSKISQFFINLMVIFSPYPAGRCTLPG